mmetsp:Transcript_7021/g.20406  ORF Transcript_7021/g.20406 Transcript_7021/m.20406 type:complete len:215 (+) Transcript_7021:853-1497(+)
MPSLTRSTVRHPVAIVLAGLSPLWAVASRHHYHRHHHHRTVPSAARIVALFDPMPPADPIARQQLRLATSFRVSAASIHHYHHHHHHHHYHHPRHYYHHPRHYHHHHHHHRPQWIDRLLPFLPLYNHPSYRLWQFQHHPHCPVLSRSMDMLRVLLQQNSHMPCNQQQSQHHLVRNSFSKLVAHCSQKRKSCLIFQRHLRVGKTHRRPPWFSSIL